MRPIPAFKSSLLAVLTIFGFAFSVPAAEPKPATPNLVTLTFWVAGVECISCVDVVSRSVADLKGVTNVSMTQAFDPYANITFDPAIVSAHQIAQAILEAPPLHGKPYEPTLRLRIPHYEKAGNAARVDAVFARQKEWVEVDTIDKTKGEFILHFLELESTDGKKGPFGWNPAQFEKPLSDPAPKGLGLAFQFETDGQEPAAGKP